MSDKIEAAVLRGVIDGLEGEWAVVALDDEQRLNWPRDRLPPEAGEGVAVVLDVRAGFDVAAQQDVGAWTGVVAVQAQAAGEEMQIRLGAQWLHCPVVRGLSAGECVVVQMQADLDDTERRRRQVQSLVDDLFG